MPVRIGNNIESLNAQRQLSAAGGALSSSFERLASGQRINKASDDAAGLSISMGLNLKSRVYSQGVRNLNDGLSYLAIGDAALKELGNITMRQIELAEQAANGVYTKRQRQAINTEANALVDEFNRIVHTTGFNGRSIIDAEQSGGQLNVQSGFDSLAFAVGSELDRQVGSGEFGQKVSITSNYLAGNSANTNSTTMADIDGDGDMDMVCGGSVKTAGGSYFGQTSVFVNDGLGNFSLKAALTSALGVNDVSGLTSTLSTALCDVDGDGDADLVAGGGAKTLGGVNRCGQVRVFLNDGAGNFSLKAAFTSNADAGGTRSTTNSIALADLNSDGALDLVSGGWAVTANTFMMGTAPISPIVPIIRCLFPADAALFAAVGLPGQERR